MAMPCPNQLWHNHKSPGPNSGIWEQTARASNLIQPHIYFSCYSQKNSSTFLLQFPNRIRDGTVSVSRTRCKWKHKWPLGEGRAVAWPGCSLCTVFNSFPALGSHCPTVIFPGPFEMLDGGFSLLFLVVQGVTADASQLPSPTSPTRTGV